MESNELIKIWKTLAEKRLIDKDLAKENIMQIISKKGSGIVNKMIKKAYFDYYVFLSAAFLVPLILTSVLIFFPGPFPNAQSYIGLSAVELFFIYMISASLRNRKFLKTTFNNESIKESVGKVNSHLKAYLKKYFLISLIFGNIFLILALTQFIYRIGGIKNISLSSSGFNLFASHLIIVILALVIIWPFLIKFEIRIRFSGIVKDINDLLDDLNKEE
jgi:hypothetical protein